MADEIRNGDSKMRVIRLLGHRDDAGAWEIRDFLKRSVVEFQCGQALERIRIGSRTMKEANWAATPRLFVAIGGVPNTDWAADTAIVRDQGGYLVTGPDLLINGKAPASWPLERAPYYLETAVPGSFAAGDVRHRSIKRGATAAGEGAMAIAFVHRYLEETA
jgi:thioredoxin reductase (NADPH)